MRWHEQTTEHDASERLPGYTDPVVRHFDAPEAIDTRFWEVRARSVLNRVPEASRMPFRWTVNPYRGCSHACTYCLAGDTAVLLADGRNRRLRDLDVGDLIVGTAAGDNHRRLVATGVEAKWSSIKRAFAIQLDDGTELIASEDHRFLTSRGWKHVLGSEQGHLRRPHLTPGAKLIGPGGFAEEPEHDADYRRGYLCGVIRGGGNLRTYDDERTGRSDGDLHGFRLALADREALARSRSYLDLDGVATQLFCSQKAVGAVRDAIVVRDQRGADSERIRALIRWPILPSRSWIKGFLAGIFDAEGSCSRGILRIAGTDREQLDRITSCLRILGFEVVLEGAGRRGQTVRLRGGLSERLRFFLTTDPAISRKRTLLGAALKAKPETRVVAVRPLEFVMRMYDITTGTGDFIANGVVSHNCFARPTHEYLGFDAGRDFEREIVVKVNAPEVLRAELGRRSWRREHVALGTNTDPYQWVEGRYELMPGIWRALLDARNPCSVLTKSPLLLRDLELMRRLNEVTEFSAALSIPTLDRKAWRATEPRSPNPRARLDAVAELTRAGIRTGVLVAPLMPGINDSPEQVGELLRLAREAGASYVGGIALHLRPGVREVFMEWLAESRPDLVDRYRELYRRGAYAAPEERRRLAAMIEGPELGASLRMSRMIGGRTDAVGEGGTPGQPAWGAPSGQGDRPSPARPDGREQPSRLF
jgi:DNA repair photolyase